MLQLVGGALGLGVLVAVYGTAYTHAASHPPAALNPLAQSQYLVTHGIAAAFGFAAILNVCSLLVIITLIRTRKLLSPPYPRPGRRKRPSRPSRRLPRRDRTVMRRGSSLLTFPGWHGRRLLGVGQR